MNSVFQRVGYVARSMMNRRSLTILSVAFILLALPLTVYLNQQRQDIRQHASSGAVCTQPEFTDLTTDVQEAVYCLSTDPVCTIKGTAATAGGASFEGTRAIYRNEAVAIIARYHVNILGDWAPMLNPATATFADMPVGTDLYQEVETAVAHGFVGTSRTCAQVYPNGSSYPATAKCFGPLQDWIVRSYADGQTLLYGDNKSDYFNPDGSTIYPTKDPITRNEFAQGFYNFNKAFLTQPHNPHWCQIQPITRCSTQTKCTMANFQSNDGGTHPLPGTLTTNLDVTCNFDPADATCQTAIQAGSGSLAISNCSTTGTCTASWNTSGITTGFVPYLYDGASVVAKGTINTAGSATITNAGGKVYTLRIGRNPDLSYDHTVDRQLAQATATIPVVPPTATPTPAPLTYTISGVVNGAPGPVTVNAGTGSGSAPKTTQTTSTGSYSFTNLPAGYYTVSIVTPSGYSQTSATVNYGVTVGANCSIIQTGSTATCVSGSATNVNFSIAPIVPTATPTIAPTNTPTPIAATNTPVPPTATATPAPNHTLLAVSFRQHGIGLPADNANPNPTITAGSVIPTPVSTFQSRPVTVYLSTGTTVNDGVPVYEYQKSGNVTFTSANGLYGYTGTIDLGTDVPSGQYIVAIRTSNSLSQQATGFASITAGQTITLTFPSLISGNVYDTSIDNATPTNDNQLDILDYNAIMDNWLNPDLCTGKSGTELTVCQTIRTRADLNADGNVDVLDYNLFIRELSVQRGR